MTARFYGSYLWLPEEALLRTASYVAHSLLSGGLLKIVACTFIDHSWDDLRIGEVASEAAINTSRIFESITIYELHSRN